MKAMLNDWAADKGLTVSQLLAEVQVLPDGRRVPLGEMSVDELRSVTDALRRQAGLIELEVSRLSALLEWIEVVDRIEQN